MTLIDRREFMKTAAAATAGAGAALAAPGAAWAKSSVTIGTAEIASVSDGALRLPAAFLFGPMDQKALPAVLEPFGMSAEAELTPPCNITLLRDGERVVLFDAGSGSNFQPSAGKLVDGLAALEVAPEDVTHVVFTHGHPDHLWGVLDDFDDKLFSEAAHMMGRAEFEYWSDAGTASAIGEDRAFMASGAKRRLDALADEIELFEDGAEILPGVAARMTPGHTPGHMSFEIGAGSESAMVVGDAISNHHVAFAKPDWRAGADQDQEQGAKTRRSLLDQLHAEKKVMVGFHLPQGGVGRVEAKDGAYRFAPL